MKTKLLLTGLLALLAAGLLTQYPQSAKAQAGGNPHVEPEPAQVVVMNYSQGQQGIMVTLISVSPGCERVPLKSDFAVAVAMYLNMGYRLLPQVVYGEQIMVKDRQ